MDTQLVHYPVHTRISIFFFFSFSRRTKTDNGVAYSIQTTIFSVAKVSKGAWKDPTTVLTVSIDRGKQAKASASETHAPFSIFSYLHRTDHSLSMTWLLRLKSHFPLYRWAAIGEIFLAGQGTKSVPRYVYYFPILASWDRGSAYLSTCTLYKWIRL